MAVRIHAQELRCCFAMMAIFAGLLAVVTPIPAPGPAPVPNPEPHFGYYFQVEHPPAPSSGYTYGGSRYSGSGYGNSYNSPYVPNQQFQPQTTATAAQTQTQTQLLKAALPLSAEVGVGQVQLPLPESYTYTNFLPAQAQPYYFDPWRVSQPASSQPPLHQPVIPASLRFRIGVVSDLDQDSSDGDGKLWHSYLKEGNLDLKQNVGGQGWSSLNSPGFPGFPAPSSTLGANANVSVSWDDSDPRTIKSGLAYSGRGMELSTLNWFNGHLYACDDKTGVVYEIPLELGGGQEQGRDIKPIPWAILADGNFQGPNGFKCEWGTIKDGDLWIGGHGKHVYNSSGVPVSSNDRFVKKITPRGEVTHMDWSDNFDKMATALGVHMPGYVIHEAAGWSESLQKWVFMPRKVSKTKFNPVRDLQSGNSIMLIADPDFNKIEVVQIGTPKPSEGFSGFKFIPGTSDQAIVALKTTTKETKGDLKSFILAFDLSGRILMNETEIAPQKYEAIEFL